MATACINLGRCRPIKGGHLKEYIKLGRGRPIKAGHLKEYIKLGRGRPIKAGHLKEYIKLGRGNLSKRATSRSILSWEGGLTPLASVIGINL
jgi:hypothetical protein